MGDNSSEREYFVQLRNKKMKLFKYYLFAVASVKAQETGTALDADLYEDSYAYDYSYFDEEGNPITAEEFAALNAETDENGIARARGGNRQKGSKKKKKNKPTTTTTPEPTTTVYQTSESTAPSTE